MLSRSHHNREVPGVGSNPLEYPLRVGLGPGSAMLFYQMTGEVVGPVPFGERRIG